MPVPQQIADFLKRGMIRQIVDVVPAISQHSLLAIDVADAGSSGGYTF
jgi:hypothetical protein